VAPIILTALAASAGLFGPGIDGNGNIYTAGGNADPATCCLGGATGPAVLAQNQVFFIGDGLTGTGSGSAQNFLVPATWTLGGLGLSVAAWLRRRRA
jgi:hypothetical protein